ncbi:MAG: cobalamin-binding protein [Chlorobiaceae bacterium]
MKPLLIRNTLLPLLLALLVLLYSGCQRRKPALSHMKEGKPAIVSLAPSLTEMMFAIGAGNQLVGRTDACDWPLAAKTVPVVGSFGRPSLEILASIHPDMVIDVDLADNESAKKISALGLRHETISCLVPDDIPRALRKLGRLTGHVSAADSLALSIEKGLDSYKKEAETNSRKRSVYLEIWDDPLWTGGKRSYTSALVAYAGGRNIGDAVDKDYFETSSEWVIRQNPDVIACMYMSKTASATAGLRGRSGWERLDAVKHARVYERFDNNIFLRPGPRVLEAVRQLHETILRN